MEPIYGKNNKEELPLAHYLEKFQAGDPAEMAARCRLPFANGELTVTLMGDRFTLSHPDFAIAGDREPTNPERILFLRYLLDGRYVEPSGAYLTYREFPWGEVYLQQFTGRCIKRFAFSYGSRPEALHQVMARLPAVPVQRGDVGYELTLMEGLTMQFILYLGDEEFPPNAQILFSDNFRQAFTAEDMANIGDITIGRMKAIAAAL
jgi:hypothetical protein